VQGSFLFIKYYLSVLLGHPSYPNNIIKGLCAAIHISSTMKKWIAMQCFHGNNSVFLNSGQKRGGNHNFAPHPTLTLLTKPLSPLSPSSL
jgi:hypothetical protein